MGQYHLTVNLDKKEFLMPHKFGVGLKLLEQMGVPSGTPDALFILMCCSNGYGGGDLRDNANGIIGRWAGDRVAVIRDYAKSIDLAMMWDAENIYNLCHDYSTDCEEYGCTADVSSHYMDISDLVIPVLMLNNPDLKIDVNSKGWRTRTGGVSGLGEMVSMDDILLGDLHKDG